jgi:hypothetical protein
MRSSLLGRQVLWRDCCEGMIGKQRGVVKGGRGEGLGGFLSGWASQDSNLSIQAKCGDVFSWQNFPRKVLNSSRFVEGTAHAPT